MKRIMVSKFYAFSTRPDQTLSPQTLASSLPSSMEFWGVEVKAGETLTVQPGDDKLLHLSQAALGESKKGTGSDSIPLFVKVGDQKLVIGSLSSEKFPQITFDLVFEKEFELSHNWKNGSVFFIGYKSEGAVDDGEFSDFSGESSDEEMPLIAEENGEPKPKAPKAKETAAKAKIQVVEPVKGDEDESDDDFDSDFDSSDEDIEGDEDDSGTDSDSEEEEEETPTPKKAGGNKKRQAESATKTPVPAKKAKASSPQKTDGKKGGHTATPHPAKNASKTPKSDNKAKSPKSGGDITCKSCSKGFKSEQAMEAHSKAKHGGGK